MPTSAGSKLTFELRVTLLDVEPAVWRVVRVPYDIRMDLLHHVLQAALGWLDSHLHQYHVTDVISGEEGVVEIPEFDAEKSSPNPDERTRLLKQYLLNPGDTLQYEYDFGDGWLHEVRLEAVHTQATRLTTGLCLDGARACPPEDCGGPGGFAEVLRTVADPKHGDEDFRNWVGKYDPDRFDLGKVNKALARRRV